MYTLFGWVCKLRRNMTKCRHGIALAAGSLRQCRVAPLGAFEDFPMLSVASRCVVGALLAGVAADPQAQVQLPTAAQLDAMVQVEVRERKIDSVAVALTRDGPVVLARA